jgi:phage shock protein C
MGTHLYRSRDDRMIAGVAGGLAELWDADPSLIRILWALLVVLTGGVALVVYIVMAVVVPEEPDDFVAGAADGTPGIPGASAAGSPAGATGTSPAYASPASDWRSQRAMARQQRRAARAARRAERGYDGRTASIVIGAILVLVGIVFLVREYLPSIDFDYIWPLALVALGVLVLLTALRPNGRSGGGSTDAT